MFKKAGKWGFSSLLVSLPVLAMAGGNGVKEMQELQPGNFGSNLAFGLAMMGILLVVASVGLLFHLRHGSTRKVMRSSNNQIRQVYTRLGVLSMLALFGVGILQPNYAEARRADPQAEVTDDAAPAPAPKARRTVRPAAPVADEDQQGTPLGLVNQAQKPVKVEMVNPSPTVVQVPTGDLADTIIKIVMLILGGLASLALAYVPFPLRGIVKSMLVDKMLTEAENFAHNAIPNAKKGDVVEVETGNEILAMGLKHALTWPDSVIKWAGGEDRIVQQLFAKLKLPADASIKDFNVKTP